jgi:hypothetical protein
MIECSGLPQVKVEGRNMDSKLQKARHVEGFVFWLRFDDGLEGELDLHESFLESPAGMLCPAELLKNFQFDETAQKLVWPGGATLDGATLHRYLCYEVAFSPSKYCPECSSERMIPVVYGLPTPELFQRAASGEVALGGCVVFGNDPGWRCSDCGHSFNYPRTRKPSPSSP